ncbi:MAG: hypothetical protein JWL92_456 [Candidatus Nomurabacteria bacterium]|nr:hypothetical protein [Candidatus Nomurabacteria bacterium]
MYVSQNNYAFIDSQNLNLNVRVSGWILDFAKFRKYLREKYQINKAFLFIGYVEENKGLYDFLEKAGYVLVFKPAIKSKDGYTKGNCDAELVLQTMIEINNFDKAVIVSGDGDFYCLVQYLIGLQKLVTVLIPNKHKYSALLRLREIRHYLRFMNDLQQKLEYQKKRPHKDGTL